MSNKKRKSDTISLNKDNMEPPPMMIIDLSSNRKDIAQAMLHSMPENATMHTIQAKRFFQAADTVRKELTRRDKLLMQETDVHHPQIQGTIDLTSPHSQQIAQDMLALMPKYATRYTIHGGNFLQAVSLVKKELLNRHKQMLSNAETKGSQTLIVMSGVAISSEALGHVFAFFSPKEVVLQLD